MSRTSRRVSRVGIGGCGDSGPSSGPTIEQLRTAAIRYRENDDIDQTDTDALAAGIGVLLDHIAMMEKIERELRRDLAAYAADNTRLRAQIEAAESTQPWLP